MDDSGNIGHVGLPDCLSQICPLIPDLGPGPSHVKLAGSVGFVRPLAQVVLCATAAVWLAVTVIVAIKVVHWARDGNLQRLLSKIRSVCCSRAAQEPAHMLREQKVKAAINMFNFEYRNKCTLVAGLISTLYLAQYAYAFKDDLVSSLVGHPTDRFVAALLFESTFPLHALHLSTFLLALSFPKLLASNLFYIPWFVMMEARWQITLYYSMNNVIEFDNYKLLEMCFRIVMTPGIWGPSITLLFNLVVGTTGAAMRWNNATWKVCLQTIATQELIEFFLVSAITLLVAGVIEARVRATLEAQSSMTLEKAAESLMSGMCDAIVHISDDCEVLRPSDSLAALILARSGQGLVGQKFTNFVMESSDRERLRKVLGKTRDGSEHVDKGPSTGTLHVVLRDSCGTPVRVQIFHTRCIDPSSNGTFHIVGIREFGDGTTERLLPSADSVGQMGPALRAPPIGPPAGDAISEHTIDSSSSVYVPMPLISSENQLEVAVIIDAQDERFPVRKCTPEFLNRIGGPSLNEGAPLLPMTDDPTSVREQVRGMVATLVATSQSQSLRALTVSFHPRWMNTHAIKVDVEVFLPRETFASFRGSKAKLVKLIFTNLKTVKAPRKEPRSRVILPAGGPLVSQAVRSARARPPEAAPGAASRRAPSSPIRTEREPSGPAALMQL